MAYRVPVILGRSREDVSSLILHGGFIMRIVRPGLRLLSGLPDHDVAETLAALSGWHQVVNGYWWEGGRMSQRACVWLEKDDDRCETLQVWHDAD